MKRIFSVAFASTSFSRSLSFLSSSFLILYLSRFFKRNLPFNNNQTLTHIFSLSLFFFCHGNFLIMNLIPSIWILLLSFSLFLHVASYEFVFGISFCLNVKSINMFLYWHTHKHTPPFSNSKKDFCLLTDWLMCHTCVFPFLLQYACFLDFCCFFFLHMLTN